MRRVPKLRRVGSWTAGPPFSVHANLNSCALSSTVDVMSMRPVVFDNAPYLLAGIFALAAMIGIAGPVQAQPSHEWSWRTNKETSPDLRING